MSIEQYNKTGLRDAYNVLRHLEKIKDKPINERKGGKTMHDEDQVPTPGAEEQVTNTAEEETPTTACDPADDPDLAEDEDSDNDGDAGETVAAD